MSNENYHKYPWPQLLLYDYNLDSHKKSFYEQYEQPDDTITFRFANLRTNTNILVKFDPALV